MEKEGRTTGLEWGGPGRVGGAPGSQASPEAAAPGRCARPCLGLWRLFRDARSSRQRPPHVGAKPEDCALGDTQRWVPKLRHSGSKLWG